MVTKQQVAKKTAVTVNKRAATQRVSKRVEAIPSRNKLVVVALRKSLGLNRQVFSRLSQFSERAIAKWEAGEPLSAPSRQRMSELKRLQKALSDVMQADFIGEWLQTPNEGFDGLKPLEVIERGEIDRLWRMIYLMESGVPS